MCDSLFIAVSEHLSKGLKRSIDALSLKCAHLEELETNLVREGLPILRSNHDAVLEVNLIGNENATKLLPVLLPDAIVPLLEQTEGVLVGHVVDEHHEVGLAEQLERNLFENVLSRDVNAVQLHFLVRVFLVQLHLLDVVLAALRHHVLVIEGLIDCLVYEASFSDSWLSCNYNARPKNRHSFFV